MTNDVSIDVGTAVPYLVETVKSWFGKDAISEESKRRFDRLIRISKDIASNVQCVGMWKPIPISNIYQTTRLLSSPPENGNTDTFPFWDLLENNTSGIIMAGPGGGKTILMHWVFNKLISSEKYLPLLITLRWPSAVEDLKEVVKDFSRKRHQPKLISKRIVLLIDGYDEVAIDDRKNVSEILREYKSYDIGAFYLTCRNHYNVYDIPAPRCWIAPFSSEDASNYCSSFLKIYGADADPNELLNELIRRGFRSFTEHPLMLALVCILHSTPMQTLPRSPLGLIERAINTLTLRWDESKGIARKSEIPLDGEERLKCLKRVAYKMDGYVSSENEVTRIVKEHVKRQQITTVDPRQLLNELAQWYGLLVPTSLEKWEFVHRTIHDYLSARYWVDTGEFASARVMEWNTKTAYALSILPDATAFLHKALRSRCEIHVFIQCLKNNAVFDPKPIAKTLLWYLKITKAVRVNSNPDFVEAMIEPYNDFFVDVSIPFLEEIIAISLSGLFDPIDKGVLAYSLYEYLRRDLSMDPKIHEMICRKYILLCIFVVNKPLEKKTFFLKDIKFDSNP